MGIFEFGSSAVWAKALDPNPFAHSFAPRHTQMARLSNEKSKARPTSKPSNAANVVTSTVLRTLRTVAGTSPIHGLAQAASLAVQITTTVQVLCLQNIVNEHIADMYTAFVAMSFIWRAGRTEN